MNIKRDKFLTEAMGECWHEAKCSYNDGWSIDYECRCGLRWTEEDNQLNNNNFSTWEGFGKLWEWVRRPAPQMIGFLGEHCENYHSNDISMYIINPDKFADAVYEYLTSKE